jgi:hypothetical protein
MNAYVRVKKQDYAAPGVERAHIASLCRPLAVAQANHPRAVALGNRSDIFDGSVIHNHAFERRQRRFRKRFETPLQHRG